MALGRRNDERQGELWVATPNLPVAPGHAFYVKLNDVLAERGFDEWVEALCDEGWVQLDSMLASVFEDGERTGLMVIAAVEVRLATAGLHLGEIDTDAKPAQERDGGNADIGKEPVGKAGDHQRCVQT